MKVPVWGKWGKIGDTIVRFCPATKGFFLFWFQTSMPDFVEIG